MCNLVLLVEARAYRNFAGQACGWIPLYLAWAGNRILTRLELEVQGWFSQSWPLHALPAPESDHGLVGPGAPSMQLHAAPGGLIPWLVAGYMAWRQQ